jgi:hypothetical protein
MICTWSNIVEKHDIQGIQPSTHLIDPFRVDTEVKVNIMGNLNLIVFQQTNEKNRVCTLTHIFFQPENVGYATMKAATLTASRQSSQER